MDIEQLIIEGDNRKIGLDQLYKSGGMVGVDMPDFITDGCVHAIAANNVPVGYYVPMSVMVELLREQARQESEHDY